MKKQLRIQIQAGTKRGKTKPPAVVIWDGIQDPLPIVKRRSKTIGSLCNRETGSEYTLEELRSLDEGEIILGSTEPTKLLPAPPSNETDVAAVATETHPATVDLLKSQLESGLKLSKHARDRMYQKDIKEEQIQQCYNNVSMGGLPGKKETPVHCSSDEVEMVVNAKDKIVITACATKKESYPFPSDRAFALKKAGLFQSMREDLAILLTYNEELEAFVLKGHERAIERAKYRLGKLLVDDTTIVRVPSPHDACGRVIGTGGVTINKIKQICKITQNISVAWDEETKEMVLSSPFPLQPKAKNTLYILVEDVVQRRPLTTCFDGGRSAAPQKAAKHKTSAGRRSSSKRSLRLS